MKLRLVIDHDTPVTNLGPWYRLEEWAPAMNRWNLVTSGYERGVRQVYDQLKTAGQHQTIIEEFDSAREPLASEVQGAQTLVSDTSDSNPLGDIK